MFGPCEDVRESESRGISLQLCASLFTQELLNYLCFTCGERIAFYSILYVNIVIVIHNSGKNGSFSLPLINSFIREKINPLLEKRKEAIRPPNVSSYPTGVAVLCELKISSSSSL